MHDVCAIVSYVDATLPEYSNAWVDIELGGSHARCDNAG